MKNLLNILLVTAIDYRGNAMRAGDVVYGMNCTDTTTWIIQEITNDRIILLKNSGYAENGSTARYKPTVYLP